MKVIESRISLSEWTDVSRNSLAVELTEVERVRAYSDAKGTTPPCETICSVVSNCAPIKIKEQSPLQEPLSGKYAYDEFYLWFFPYLLFDVDFQNIANFVLVDLACSPRVNQHKTSLVFCYSVNET